MYQPSHPHPLQQHRQHPVPSMAPLTMPQSMAQPPPPPYGVRPEQMPPSPAVEDSETPPTISKTWDNKIWTLSVLQQPVRARMCGFGDKDRRPITPPPCIKLTVLDARTRKEIDLNTIDSSFFVLTVDLWDEHGRKEVNLVRHAAQSPSISSATSASFSAAQQSQQSPGFPPTHSQPHSGYPNSAGPYPSPGSYYGQSSYPPHPSPYAQPPLNPVPSPYQVNQNGVGMQGLMTQPQGMFTRNLIGSLSASAFRLTDPDDKLGIWFILQDLSVRTEGCFRLKVSFVNVGQTMPYGDSDHRATNTVLNTGLAPVLSTAFTDKFTVYSAKKFPGVIESTSLSKCFAQQGIKIPIRKDAKPGKDEDDDDY